MENMKLNNHDENNKKRSKTHKVVTAVVLSLKGEGVATVGNA